MPKIRRVLMSVTDKTGVAAFAGRLAEQSVEIVSTGGTARLLREAGLAVRDVSTDCSANRPANAAIS